MKVHHIAICEQTHAKCRGYAPDDHIAKECYTIVPTPEQEQELAALIERIGQNWQDDFDKNRYPEWLKRNPDAKECCGEGEEFIGSTWVETSSHETENEPSYSTLAEEVLAKLRRMS